MKLAVSEHFYSIQGEGKTMGVPAVFLRLTACNLMCGGRGTEKDKQLHHGATWRCDSIEVWRSGTSYEIEEFVELFFNKYEKYFNNRAHLIITGGEPTLQQKQLDKFLELLIKRLGFKPFIEIETNGTIIPQIIYEHLDLINCSPKLSNSGEPEKKRIKPDTLQFLNLSPLTIFKFVVSSSADVDEIMALITDNNLDLAKIYLMPSAQDQDELKQNTKIVSELCMKHGFNFSTRLQIIIWNETTGV